MKSFLTLSAGLVAGVFTSLLLVRAGFPPALAGLVLWMAGGVFGVKLYRPEPGSRQSDRTRGTPLFDLPMADPSHR